MANKAIKGFKLGEDTLNFVDQRVGELTGLSTTEKESIVGAINEAAESYTLSETDAAAIAAVAEKVDAVEGKGLSSNDFTDDLKTKLDGLSNYDDSTLSGRVESLESLVADGENVTEAIDTFNEVVSFLNNIENTETLEGVLAGKVNAVEGKGLSSNDYDADAVAEVAKVAGLGTSIGDLSKLNTTAKADLVSAINEAAAGSGAASMVFGEVDEDDYLIVTTTGGTTTDEPEPEPEPGE